jgi:hypothetical protein
MSCLMENEPTESMSGRGGVGGGVVCELDMYIY